MAAPKASDKRWSGKTLLITGEVAIARPLSFQLSRCGSLSGKPCHQLSWESHVFLFGLPRWDRLVYFA